MRGRFDSIVGHTQCPLRLALVARKHLPIGRAAVVEVFEIGRNDRAQSLERVELPIVIVYGRVSSHVSANDLIVVNVVGQQTGESNFVTGIKFLAVSCAVEERRITGRTAELNQCIRVFRSIPRDSGFDIIRFCFNVGNDRGNRIDERRRADRGKSRSVVVFGVDAIPAARPELVGIRWSAVGHERNAASKHARRNAFIQSQRNAICDGVRIDLHSNSSRADQIGIGNLHRDR